MAPSFTLKVHLVIYNVLTYKRGTAFSMLGSIRTVRIKNITELLPCDDKANLDDFVGSKSWFQGLIASTSL